MENTQLVHYNI